MPGLPNDYKNAWSGDPTNDSGGDAIPVTLALRMKTDVAGRVFGVRFFRDLADGDPHIGMLFAASNLELLDVTLFHQVVAAGSGADGWHSAYFRKAHRFAADDRFVVGVMFGHGRYWLTPGALNGTDMTNGNLHITADGDGGDNGLYQYGFIIPDQTFGHAAYGVDVIFLEDA